MSWVEDSQGWDSVATLAWSQGRWGGSLLPPHSAPVWPKSQPEEAQSPPVKPGKTGVVRHLEPPGLTFQMRKLRRWEVQWFEQSSELRLVEQG